MNLNSAISPLNGDRLPVPTTTKRGGVPPLGTPTGKFLKDDGTWETSSGSGDMTKVVYDIYDVGIVDNSQKLEGSTKTEVQNHSPITHNQDASTINAGILDGDRLPTLSQTKKGGVPATGVPSGKFLKDDNTWATMGGGSPPPWKGAIAGTFGDGDPNKLLYLMLHNPINATPTNISITIARIAYFKLDTDLVVNKIRCFGVGATTNVYRTAIYRDSDSMRLTNELAFTTSSQAWVSIIVSPSVTLVAGILYFIAVSVNATGTTAGLLCHSASTGRIGVLPTLWLGNLNITNLKIDSIGFAQFPVTAGALPNPAPSRVPQATWTGGMPAFFLDNNDA